MWHAHAGYQRADGVFGAFIVRQRDSPHSHLYDEDRSDHVIVFNDWFNDTVTYKFAAHMHSDGREEANAKSILINGHGARRAFVNGTNEIFKTPRAIFKVSSGERYRFRLIHAGLVYCPIQFSIDNHNFSLISVDSYPIEKLDNLESAFLYPGKLNFLILIYYLR